MRDLLQRARALGERHLSQRAVQLRRIALPAPGGQTDEQPAIAWSEWLILFFRVMAIFQLAKGLVHWGFLIAGTESVPLPAGDLVELHAANIYFAVLDPVAGVGLWLTSSWGAVLWLLAAMSQIAVLIGFPEIFGLLPLLIVFELAAVGAYLFLTWKLARAGKGQI